MMSSALIILFICFLPTVQPLKFPSILSAWSHQQQQQQQHHQQQQLIHQTDSSTTKNYFGLPSQSVNVISSNNSPLKSSLRRPLSFLPSRHQSIFFNALPTSIFGRLAPSASKNYRQQYQLLKDSHSALKGGPPLSGIPISAHVSQNGAAMSEIEFANLIAQQQGLTSMQSQEFNMQVPQSQAHLHHQFEPQPTSQQQQQQQQMPGQLGSHINQQQQAQQSRLTNNRQPYHDAGDHQPADGPNSGYHYVRQTATSSQYPSNTEEVSDTMMAESQSLTRDKHSKPQSAGESDAPSTTNSKSNTNLITEIVPTMMEQSGSELAVTEASSLNATQAATTIGSVSLGYDGDANDFKGHESALNQSLSDLEAHVHQVEQSMVMHDLLKKPKESSVAAVTPSKPIQPVGPANLYVNYKNDKFDKHQVQSDDAMDTASADFMVSLSNTAQGVVSSQPVQTQEHEASEDTESYVIGPYNGPRAMFHQSESVTNDASETKQPMSAKDSMLEQMSSPSTTAAFAMAVTQQPGDKSSPIENVPKFYQQDDNARRPIRGQHHINSNDNKQLHHHPHNIPYFDKGSLSERNKFDQTFAAPHQSNNDHHNGIPRASPQRYRQVTANFDQLMRENTQSGSSVSGNGPIHMFLQESTMPISGNDPEPVSSVMSTPESTLRDEAILGAATAANGYDNSYMTSKMVTLHQLEPPTKQRKQAPQMLFRGKLRDSLKMPLLSGFRLPYRGSAPQFPLKANRARPVVYNHHSGAVSRPNRPSLFGKSTSYQQALVYPGADSMSQTMSSMNPFTEQSNLATINSNNRQPAYYVVRDNSNGIMMNAGQQPLSHKFAPVNHHHHSGHHINRQRQQQQKQHLSTDSAPVKSLDYYGHSQDPSMAPFIDAALQSSMFDLSGAFEKGPIVSSPNELKDPAYVYAGEQALMQQQHQLSGSKKDIESLFFPALQMSQFTPDSRSKEQLEFQLNDPQSRYVFTYDPQLNYTSGKKFKSGLYEIEPPRSLSSESGDKNGQRPIKPQSEEEKSSYETNMANSGEGNLTRFDNSQNGFNNSLSDGNGSLPTPPTPTVASVIVKQSDSVQNSDVTVLKQIGASIEVGQGAKNAPESSGDKDGSDSVMRGKVFNDSVSSPDQPVSSETKKELSDDDEGEKLQSETKQFKQTEMVTLYEFEGPQSSTSPAPLDVATQELTAAAANSSQSDDKTKENRTSDEITNEPSSVSDAIQIIDIDESPSILNSYRAIMDVPVQQSNDEMYTMYSPAKMIQGYNYRPTTFGNMQNNHNVQFQAQYQGTPNSMRANDNAFVMISSHNQGSNGASQQFDREQQVGTKHNSQYQYKSLNTYPKYAPAQYYQQQQSKPALQWHSNQNLPHPARPQFQSQMPQQQLAFNPPRSHYHQSLNHNMPIDQKFSSYAVHTAQPQHLQSRKPLPVVPVYQFDTQPSQYGQQTTNSPSSWGGALPNRPSGFMQPSIGTILNTQSFELGPSSLQSMQTRPVEDNSHTNVWSTKEIRPNHSLSQANQIGVDNFATPPHYSSTNRNVDALSELPDPGPSDVELGQADETGSKISKSPTRSADQTRHTQPSSTEKFQFETSNDSQDDEKRFTNQGKGFESQSVSNNRPISSQDPATQDSDAHQSAADRSAGLFCANRPPGMYADVNQKCKVYYLCGPSGQQQFRCGNQTQFNQKTLTCDWWYNTECGKKLNENPDDDLNEQAVSRSSQHQPMNSDDKSTWELSNRPNNNNNNDKQVSESEVKSIVGSASPINGNNEGSDFDRRQKDAVESVRQFTPTNEVHNKQADYENNKNLEAQRQRWRDIAAGSFSSSTEHSTSNEPITSDMFHHSESASNTTVAPTTTTESAAKYTSWPTDVVVSDSSASPTQVQENAQSTTDSSAPRVGDLTDFDSSPEIHEGNLVTVKSADQHNDEQSSTVANTNYNEARDKFSTPAAVDVDVTSEASVANTTRSSESDAASDFDEQAGASKKERRVASSFTSDNSNNDNSAKPFYSNHKYVRKSSAVDQIFTRGNPREQSSGIYSTLSNQGSVNYDPTNVHTLTPNNSRGSPSATLSSGSSASNAESADNKSTTIDSKSATVERRYGQRLAKKTNLSQQDMMDGVDYGGPGTSSIDSPLSVANEPKAKKFSSRSSGSINSNSILFGDNPPTGFTLIAPIVDVCFRDGSEAFGEPTIDDSSKSNEDACGDDDADRSLSSPMELSPPNGISNISQYNVGSLIKLQLSRNHSMCLLCSAVIAFNFPKLEIKSE
ncbi:hypothetical protein GZH46_01102, partial [Fragariocoptes setiger]